MDVIIVSGGRAPSLKLFKSLLKINSFIIAADAGGEFLKENNIIPDLLVGDFDSISDESLLYFENKAKIIHYEKEKDFSDTEGAFKEALKLNPDTIYFLGSTGTRIDHFLGNLSFLNDSLEKGISSFIVDDYNKIFLVDRQCEIKKDFGDYISFQSFRGDVANFSLQGAKYKLKNYTLKMGDTRTISNEFLAETIKVKFKKGKVLVILSKD